MKNGLMEGMIGMIGRHDGRHHLELLSYEPLNPLHLCWAPHYFGCQHGGSTWGRYQYAKSKVVLDPTIEDPQFLKLATRSKIPLYEGCQ